MDEQGLRTAAMTVLRDALNAEIAALRIGLSSDRNPR